MVTTPLRTAYDLARREDLAEAVVAVDAVDALANRGRFAPDLLLHFAAHYPRARGNADWPRPSRTSIGEPAHRWSRVCGW